MAKAAAGRSKGVLITLFSIALLLWVNQIRTVEEFLALVALELFVWALMRNLY